MVRRGTYHREKNLTQSLQIHVVKGSSLHGQGFDDREQHPEQHPHAARSMSPPPLARERLAAHLDRRKDGAVIVIRGTRARPQLQGDLRALRVFEQLRARRAMCWLPLGSTSRVWKRASAAAHADRSSFIQNGPNLVGGFLPIRA